MRWLLISCVLLFAFFTNCQKEVEIQINGNKTPKYDDVPTIHVENYINRLFIDLLGREPTDTMGAMSVMGYEDRKSKYRPLIPGTSFIEFNDFDAINQITTKTAAIILETIQGGSSTSITCVHMSRGMFNCAGADARFAFIITRFNTSQTREGSRTSSW